jgi:hypothetical protein
MLSGVFVLASLYLLRLKLNTVTRYYDIDE